MRPLTLCVALTSLTLVTACGGDSEEATGSAATSTTASAAPSASASASASTSASTSNGAGGTVLTATVGTANDPDAFVIDLTNGSGEKVTTLPAGSYTINVSDPSEIHNWHLTGGSVDETTTVPEVTDRTFQVTLEPGQYTYICDPHPRMVGQFTVT